MNQKWNKFINLWTKMIFKFKKKSVIIKFFLWKKNYNNEQQKSLGKKILSQKIIDISWFIFLKKT